MVNNNEMLIDAIMEQLPSFSVGINNPKDPGNYDYARGIAESIAEVVTVHYQPNITSKKCDGKQTCSASCATLLEQAREGLEFYSSDTKESWETLRKWMDDCENGYPIAKKLIAAINAATGEK